MFNIFKSKQKREAEALAKLKEEQARKKREDYYRGSSSDSYVWIPPLVDATYYSDASAFVKADQISYNTLSEGSGSFSGAGASSSWSSSSSDDSSSSNCSSSSYSSSYSSSSDSYSSSSSDSSSSCSSSD